MPMQQRTVNEIDFYREINRGIEKTRKYIAF